MCDKRERAITCVFCRDLYLHYKCFLVLYQKICLKAGEVWRKVVSNIILLHEKFLQFDWLRAVVFKLNLKYLHVKITTLLWVVV